MITNKLFIINKTKLLIYFPNKNTVKEEIHFKLDFISWLPEEYFFPLANHQAIQIRVKYNLPVDSVTC